MPDHNDMMARHDHLAEKNQELISKCVNRGIVFDPAVELRIWQDVIIERLAEVLAVTDMSMAAEDHLLALQIAFQEKVDLVVQEAYEEHSKPKIEVPGR